MNLIKRITDNGVTYGYMVEDDGEKYPILEQALWCEVIANSLLESGYKLLALPYGFVKPDGTPIEEIEAVSLESLELTDMQKVEMRDMLVTRMKKATMATLVSDNGKVGGHTFKKLKVLISTRDDLIKYLEEHNTKRKNSTDLKDILPINAITSDSALLSAEEWNDPQYIDFKRMIREYATLSYEQFEILVKAFKDLGLGEHFTPKEFVDVYLSFGVPGLRIENAVVNEEDSEIVFGTNYNVQDLWDKNAEKNLPFIKEVVSTYMDANGDVHKTARTSTGNWKLKLNPKQKKNRIIALNSQGIEYITPVEIETRVTEKVTTIANENIGVRYDDTFMEVTANGGSRSISTFLTVIEPGTSKALASKYYNADKAVLEEHLQCEALSKHLIDRLTVKAYVSSYKALQAVGASPLAALNYYINREDIAEYWSLNHYDSTSDTEIIYKALSREDQDKLARKVKSGPEMARLIGLYLKDELPEHNELYPTIDHIVTSFLTGSLDIDGVNQGKSVDSKTSALNKYYDYIHIALKYLEMEPRKIYELIGTVTDKTPSITLEGKGMKMVVPLAPMRYAVDMFLADVENYRMRQAAQASVIGHVTEVYTELASSRVPGKHVGVKYLMFNLKDKKIAKSVNTIIDKLTLVFEECIASAYKQTDVMAIELKKRVRNCVLAELFRIATTGKMVISKEFLGQKIVQGESPFITLDMTKSEVEHPVANISEYIFGKSIMDGLRACLSTAISSTTLLADNTINFMGMCRTYFVNCTITPEYVIPKPGFRIKEMNLNAVWMKFVPEMRDQMIKAFSDNKLLPEETIDTMRKGNYRSLEVLYRTNHYPMGSDQAVSTFAGNLITYVANAKEELRIANTDTDIFCRPKHPLKYLYPALDRIFDKKEIKDTVDGIKNAKGNYVYKITPWQYITAEDVYSRNPELKNLGKVDTDMITLANNFKVRDFEGLPVEVFLSTESPIRMLDNITEGKPIIFYNEANGDLIFGKDEVVNARDIEDAYKSGKYKIRKLTASRYLIQNIKGLFVEVEL